MSNIDKQALRLTAEKAKDNFMPNFMVPTRDVLALLDENAKLLREKDVMEAAALAMRDDMRLAREQLKAAELRIAELDRSETQLILERDSAEKAIADMYEAAMGESPEWSNLFGYAEAIDDVAQHINFLDLAAATGNGE